MPFSISLTAEERNALLGYYRSDPDPQLRLRAHIILLLAEGFSWAMICAVLFCSSRTIARWKARFEQDRLDGLWGRQRGPATRFGPRWLALVVAWVTTQTPRAFGFLRSRWCCEVIVLLLWRLHRLDVSRETVRRHLHRADLVWRRPRPVLDRRDPQREEIVAGLRRLLLTLPDNETAVFEDEVDVELNPKIGCQWMRRGQQAEVVTPGDNAKRYLAGSLHWRTGALITTEGAKRDGVLFVAHLEELCRRLRHYKVIHVIVDNAKFHECWAVAEFLYKARGRVVLHYLPKYAPDLNPIERVWWRLHEAITRNHQCHSIEELVDLALAWLTKKKTFKVQDEVYLQEQPKDKAQAA